MAGFYLMHRGWQDHSVFRNEAFSRRDAFVWLIEEAAFKPCNVHMPKGEITLERGQLGHSLRFMAKSWKWDEARVRRFLTSLQKEKIIDAHTDAGQTIITICNYEIYQSAQNSPDAPTDAAATQQRRGGDAKIKKYKEVNTLQRAREGNLDVSLLAKTVCEKAGFVMPDPSKDWSRHNDVIGLVQGWLDAGADPSMITETVATRRAAARSTIKSLMWFDAAVRDAIASRDTAQSKVDADTDFLVNQILERKRAKAGGAA